MTEQSGDNECTNADIKQPEAKNYTNAVKRQTEDEKCTDAEIRQIKDIKGRVLKNDNQEMKIAWMVKKTKRR